MIRQPSFVTADYTAGIVKMTKKKKPHKLSDSVKFEEIEEGSCIQMYIGSYDSEPQSFIQTEIFAEEQQLKR